MLDKDKGLELEVGFHQAKRPQIVQSLFERLQLVMAMLELLLSAQLYLHASLPNFSSGTLGKLRTANFLFKGLQKQNALSCFYQPS
jgi:hypothetical protein